MPVGAAAINNVRSTLFQHGRPSLSQNEPPRFGMPAPCYF
jgi:hypothetical protein